MVGRRQRSKWQVILTITCTFITTMKGMNCPLLSEMGLWGVYEESNNMFKDQKCFSMQTETKTVHWLKFE